MTMQNMVERLEAQGKKTILVGVRTKREAHCVIENVINELLRKNIRVTYNKRNAYFETPHTHVRYVCMDDRFEDLCGYMADAVFGSPWLQILERMKPGAFDWKRRNSDVTDYICYVENVARMKEGLVSAYPSLKPMFNSVYGMHGDFKFGATINNEFCKFKGEINMPTREEEIYVKQNIEITRKLWEEFVLPKQTTRIPGIKNVIFSGPMTIVLWEDGTKTKVRCTNDEFDPEKGLAMAIAKKALGTNKSGSNYYDIFKKWLPKEGE